jgi:hypothetical protein
MKSHSSKEARVAENESLPRLLQDKMVVFLRMESSGFRPQFAAHPEMNSNPIPRGEFEQHLLAARGRAQETASRQVGRHFLWIAPAKNPFPGMELHRHDPLAETCVPLLAKKFHLSQFRHLAK